MVASDLGEAVLRSYSAKPEGVRTERPAFGCAVADCLVLRTVAAVPEPANWAMMIGGFGLIGAELRRRKGIVRLA